MATNTWLDVPPNVHNGWQTREAAAFARYHWQRGYEACASKHEADWVLLLIMFAIGIFVGVLAAKSFSKRFGTD